MLKQKLFRGRDERGVVLLVVLGMLFLFAALGLTFAVISRSEGIAARNFKRQLSNGLNAPDPTAYINSAISQLLYDTTLTASALRGHSLARDMYGGWTANGQCADPRANNASATGENPNQVAANLATGPYHVDSLPSGAPQSASYLNWWRNAFNGPGIPAFSRHYGLPSDVTGSMSGTAGDFRPDLSAPPATLNKQANLDVINALRTPFFRGYDAANNLDPAFELHPANQFPLNFTLFSVINRDSINYRDHFRNYNYPRNGAATGAVAATGAATVADFGNFRIPERYHRNIANINGANNNVYAGYDEDYDYADWNNMFLAMERADGTMLIPSFHRPQLIWDLERRGVFDQNGTVGTAWSSDYGWRVILRPRRRERAAGPADTSTFAQPGMRNPLRVNGVQDGAGNYFDASNNQWKDLVDLNNNGIVGDCPEELDVDTDGDGKKDAVWLDIFDNTRVVSDGAGGYMKPLLAYKVISLDGRVNLQTAGSLVKDTKLPIGGNGNGASSSNLGASVAEINPKHAMPIEYVLPGINNWNNTDPAKTVPPPAIPTLRVYPPTIIGAGSMTSSLHEIVSLKKGNNFGTASLTDDIPGVYSNGVSGGPYGATSNDAPGVFNFDDIYTDPVGLTTNNAINWTNFTPATINYPAAQFEGEFFYLAGAYNGYRSVIHPGYDDQNQYYRMFYPVTGFVVPTTAPGTDYFVGGSANEGLPDNRDNAAAYTIPLTSPNRVLTGSYLWGQRDYLGIGRFNPPATMAIGQAADVMGSFANYERSFLSTTMQTGGIAPIYNSWVDEPTEVNPYNGFTNDTLFLESWFQSAYRYNDVDYASQPTSLVSGLAPKNFQEYPDDLNTPDNYLRQRTRNMFTPQSWDTNMYCAPPEFSSYNSAANASFPRAPIVGGPVAPSQPRGDDDMSQYSQTAAPWTNSSVNEYSTFMTGNSNLMRHINGSFDGVVYRDDANGTIVPPGGGTAATVRSISPNATYPNPTIPQTYATPQNVVDGAISRANEQFVVNPIQLLPGSVGLPAPVAPAPQGFGVFHPGVGTTTGTLGNIRLDSAPYGTAVQTTYNLFPKEILDGHRFNLNRPMRRYRETTWNTGTTPAGLIGTNVGAETDRQIMAAQIYMILRAATHTPDPDLTPSVGAQIWNPGPGANQRTKKIQQLAQLAVNIVDYMDYDDVNTRFWFDPYLRDNVWSPYFDPTGAAILTGNVVYGFELPHLVVNEAIGLWASDLDIAGIPSDATWLITELSNPWPAAMNTDNAYQNYTIDTTTGTLTANGDKDELGVGRLALGPPADNQMNSRQLARIYKLEVDLTGTGAGYQAIDFTTPGAVTKAGRGTTIHGKVLVNAALARNDFSYFVCGPDFNTAPPPTGDAILNNMNPPGTTFSTNELDYYLNGPSPFVSVVPHDPAVTAPPAQMKIRLSRLRNPYEQQQTTNRQNDYIVTDEVTIQNTPTANTTKAIYNISRFRTGPNAGQLVDTSGAIEERRSWERAHPWSVRSDVATSATRGAGQHITAIPNMANDPTHSFLGSFTVATQDHRGNRDVTGQDWYIHHINRPLASPMELLDVRLFSARNKLNPFTATGYNAAVNAADEVQLSFTDLFGSTPPSDYMMQTPWFRDFHDDNTAINGQYLDPTTSTYAAAPITMDVGGDLYRFFEFVETPSRLRGAGASWQPNDFVDFTLPAGQPNRGLPSFRYPDYRATRVAGKVFLNGGIEEEVFRAVADTDEVNPPNTESVINDWTRYNNMAWTPVPGLPAYPIPHIFRDQYPLSDIVGSSGVAGTSGTFDRAGTRPDRLVNSEMFKNMLQSIAGQDGVLGTADDRPFRSYAASSINDTLLRVKGTVQADPNPSMLDQYREWNAATITTTYRAGENSVRLFDSATNTYGPGPVGEEKNNTELFERNRLLAKLAGNVTTRSHVFGVWITLGWFRVVPGTQTEPTCLLSEEIGASEGKEIRTRYFFMVDRSKMTGYTGPKNNNYNPATDPVIILSQKIE